MTTETSSATTAPSFWQKFFTGLKNSGPQWRNFFVDAVGQVRILKKIYPGIMHFLLFWGFTIQIIGTSINLMQMQLFIPFVELPFPRGNLYLAFELAMDLAGGAILIGILMAAFRRYVLRPKTLVTKWDDTYVLVLLALIPIVGFTNESMRLVASSPAWAGWSPIGNALANFWRSLGMTPETAANMHAYMFWSHAALALILLASTPFTKFRHVFMIPINIILHPLRKEGAIEKIENIDEAETLGAGKPQDFASTQLLSFEACVQCGRCEEVCPANISGMPYSPRVLIQDLRKATVLALSSPNGQSEQEILGSMISEEYPWYCTTCGACLVKCPAFVNPIDQVIDLRRYQVLTSGNMQKSIGDVLRNVERQGNPWGMPAEDRMAWAEGLGVRELKPGESTDVLLFLGCAFAYDDRNKKVAQSFVKLLQKSGVDFAVLGMDESCCGETARRMGHEYLFQVFAQQNIEAFGKVKFNRIVTQCPHCFNTLKNEYPQMGGVYKVQHYTEYLAELTLPKLSPNGKSIQGRLAYHDSCYLGRYNHIYSQPRNILDNAKVNRIELPRKLQNSFCCGGGGGQMWMETDAETRINHRRLDEAMKAEAEVVATACPYCLIMFDDAIRSKGVGDKIEVLDIAEVLERQME